MLLLIPFSFFLLPFIFPFFNRHAYLFLLIICSITTIIPFVSAIGIYENSWFTLGGKEFKVSFNNDGITQLLIFLVNFIGACVIIYSQYYFKKSSFRYWTYLCLFLGSMQGMLLSNHAILLFIFWELVGISSFLLIGYYNAKPEAIYGSSKALWINKIGDIGFLIGILGIYTEYKSFDIHLWTEAGQFDGGRTWYCWLLIMGAIAKSAQGPFMIWLPDAMAGPTPASALIHAATMVAAGIYLLFRLQVLFSSDIQQFLVGLGSLSALLGAIYALFSFRLKAILAGSTISQLGWMLAAVGSSFPYAAMEHFWAHAFFKAGLFLMAGIIIHYQEKQNSEHDPQDIRSIANFCEQYPWLYGFLGVLFAALMGIPFTSGFLTKEVILSALSNSVAFYILILSAFFTTLYSFKVLWALRKVHQKISRDYSISQGMLIPVIILSVCSLFWVVSLNPFHIEKTGLPSVSISITWISILNLVVSILCFWKYHDVILGLSSKVIQGFWGLNTFYNVWTSQNFIMKVETIENRVNGMTNRFINPWITVGKFFIYLEQGLVGLILGLKSFLVTGRWMGMPVSVAHFFQWLDTYLWDFSISSIAHSILNISQINKKLMTTKIQRYLIYSLVFLLIGGLLWRYVIAL